MNSNCDEIYYGVRDAEGHINHTTISTTPEDAIEAHLAQEQTMNQLYNAARELHGKPTQCCSSWEGFESRGFSVVKLRIVEA